MTRSLRQKVRQRKRCKENLEIIQTALTILVILFGAIWFLLKDEGGAKANIEHKIYHEKLYAEDDSINGWVWVHLEVTLKNKGEVPILLEKGVVWLERIFPLEKSFVEDISNAKNIVSEKTGRVTWKMVGEPTTHTEKASIGKGEEETFEYDFIVPAFLKTISLYSEYEMPIMRFGLYSDGNLVWRKSSIYQLFKKGEKK